MVAASKSLLAVISQNRAETYYILTNELKPMRGDYIKILANLCLEHEPLSLDLHTGRVGDVLPPGPLVGAGERAEQPHLAHLLAAAAADDGDGHLDRGVELAPPGIDADQRVGVDHALRAVELKKNQWYFFSFHFFAGKRGFFPLTSLTASGGTFCSCSPILILFLSAPRGKATEIGPAGVLASTLPPSSPSVTISPLMRERTAKKRGKDVVDRRMMRPVSRSSDTPFRSMLVTTS